jgi:hypothetical protein
VPLHVFHNHWHATEHIFKSSTTCQAHLPDLFAILAQVCMAPRSGMVSQSLYEGSSLCPLQFKGTLGSTWLCIGEPTGRLALALHIKDIIVKWGFKLAKNTCVDGILFDHQV